MDKILGPDLVGLKISIKSNKVQFFCVALSLIKQIKGTVGFVWWSGYDRGGYDKRTG